MKATSKATPKEPHGWELRGVECIACGNVGDITQYFPCCDCAKALRKRVASLQRLLLKALAEKPKPKKRRKA